MNTFTFIFCLILSFSLFSCQSNKISILKGLATIEATVTVNKEDQRNNKYESSIDVVLKANLAVVKPGYYPKLVKGSKAILKYDSNQTQIQKVICESNVICTYNTESIIIEFKYTLEYLFLRYPIKVTSTNNVVINSIFFIEAL